MTSISSLYSGQYYQLPTQAGGTATAPSTATAPAAGAPANASLADSAYLLDLSPQAQDYLNGIGSSSANTSAPLPSGSSFVLTASQQQALSAILAKYKDAPQTQDTFVKIQDDMKAAGLSPDQLSKIDKATSFDPTLVLIGALNGDFSVTGVTSDADEQTKSSNYVQQVLKQWQSISTAPADGSDNIAADLPS